MYFRGQNGQPLKAQQKPAVLRRVLTEGNVLASAAPPPPIRPRPKHTFRTQQPAQEAQKQEREIECDESIDSISGDGDIGPAAASLSLPIQERVEANASAAAASCAEKAKEQNDDDDDDFITTLIIADSPAIEDDDGGDGEKVYHIQDDGVVVGDEPPKTAAKNDDGEIPERRHSSEDEGSRFQRLSRPPGLPVYKTPSSMSSAATEELLTKRSRVAEELLTTEESYVAGLNTFIREYLPPLRDVGIPSSDMKEMARVFSMMETLASLHGTMLDQLRQRMANWQGLGDVIGGLVPFMKLYVEFVTNYSGALEDFKQFRRNRKFMRVIKHLAASRAGGGVSEQAEFNKFGSLLVTPIQRIPRYTLLLKDLLGSTPSDGDYANDYASIEEAYNKVTELAEYINEQKRREESSRRLNRVTQGLRGDLSSLRMSVLDPNAIDASTFKSLRTHHWSKKSWSAPVWCFFCNKLLYDDKGSKFRGVLCRSCKYPAHSECAVKVPKSCGLLKNMKESLIQHDRSLIAEFRCIYKRKLPANIERKIGEKRGREQLAPLPCTLFLFNDSIVAVQVVDSSSSSSAAAAAQHLAEQQQQQQRSASSSSFSASLDDDEDSNRYNVLCMVKWRSRMTKRQIQMIADPSKPTLVIIPPRESDMVHTFTFPNDESMRHAVDQVQAASTAFLDHEASDHQRQKLIQRERMNTFKSKTAVLAAPTSSGGGEGEKRRKRVGAFGSSSSSASLVSKSAKSRTKTQSSSPTTTPSVAAAKLSSDPHEQLQRQEHNREPVVYHGDAPVPALASHDSSSQLQSMFDEIDRERKGSRRFAKRK
jgi:RhoGEF domain/Phorbol esters/diacylglycerol binding domain (C1 domain)